MRPLCLALLLCVGLLPAADAGLPDFLPVRTKVIMGVRLQAITASPLFEGYASQAVSAGSDWMNVATFMGFNPLKDIDELLIATTSGGQNAPALLVIRGRFNLERLSAGAKRYHGVPLLATGKGSGSLTAVLDASTAIAGEAELVRTAIDRRGKGDAISSALAARAESLRTRYDLWGVGQVPEGVKVPAGQAPGLESVDRFEFGLLLSHGIEASAELHARSVQDVQKLAAYVQILKAAMASQANRSSGVKGVQIDTHVDGDTLKMSLAVPEDVLRETIQTRSASMHPAPAGSAVTISRTPAPLSHPPASATGHPAASEEADTVVLTLPGKQ